MMVFTGRRYLGRFIVDMEAEDTWLAEKVKGWTELVKTLSGVAHKHLKYDYAGLQKSIQ